MIIKGATGVAIAAAIGNLLQGWDGGAIAGGSPNITRTFFFFFLLPLTSSSSLVSLTVTARPSICLSTTLLLRVQGLLQGKKNTLQGKPTGFKLPFPTCSKLLVQIYESSLSTLSSFVPPLHHQEHQMQ